MQISLSTVVKITPSTLVKIILSILVKIVVPKEKEVVTYLKNRGMSSNHGYLNIFLTLIPLSMKRICWHSRLVSQSFKSTIGSSTLEEGIQTSQLKMSNSRGRVQRNQLKMVRFYQKYYREANFITFMR